MLFMLLDLLGCVFSKNPVISNGSHLDGLTARIEAAESVRELITSTWNDFETPKLNCWRLNICKIHGFVMLCVATSVKGPLKWLDFT